MVVFVIRLDAEKSIGREKKGTELWILSKNQKGGLGISSNELAVKEWWGEIRNITTL